MITRTSAALVRLLPLLLLATQACAALSEDGTAFVAGGPTAVIQASTGGLTTAQAGDIIVLFVMDERTNATGSHTTVSSVNDLAGLVWAKRSSAFNDNAGTTNAYSEMEVWWAFSSGTLSGDVITVHFNATVDGVMLEALGVTGFVGTSYKTTPWDSNGTLPASAKTASAGGDPTVAGVSTTAAATMLIAVAGGAENFSPAGNCLQPGAGFTGYDSVFCTGLPYGLHINIAGTNDASGAAEYKVVAAPQSGISVNFHFPVASSPSWMIIADALSGETIIHGSDLGNDAQGISNKNPNSIGDLGISHGL